LTVSIVEESAKTQHFTIQNAEENSLALYTPKAGPQTTEPRLQTLHWAKAYTSLERTHRHRFAHINDYLPYNLGLEVS
jgi:hypothetical protein